MANELMKGRARIIEQWGTPKRAGGPHNIEILDRLVEVFGSLEAAETWLQAPNPLLAGELPITYLLRGHTVTIMKLLRMAETGMPT